MKNLMQKKIIRDSSYLITSGYIGQFLSFIRGFVIARLLDPTLFGYLSGARLVLLFTSQMHLGALHGMTREFSLAKGSDDDVSFNDSKENGITLIAIFSLITMCSIIIYTFIINAKYSPYVIWGVRIFAIVAFVRQAISICHALLRVDYRFGEISISEIIKGSSSLVLAITLVYFFGLYGAMVSSLLAHLITFSYLFKRLKLKLKFKLDIAKVKTLIFTGIPISFFYFNSEILKGLDRIMIITFLNVKELGYYAIALPFFTLITKIPSSISYIIYPKMLEAYSKSNGNVESTRNYFMIPTRLNAVITAISIGILFISVKYIFNYFLPKYIDAVNVVKILSFSIFFSSISGVAIRVLITQNKFKILFVFQSFAILINLTLNYLFLKMGYGIEGVALATGISYCGYAILTLRQTLSNFYSGFWVITANQIKIYWPIMYIGVIIYMMMNIDILKVDAINCISEDVYHLVINLTLYTILTAPIFFFTNKRLIMERS